MHSYGLGVAYVGEAPMPDPLRWLMDAAADAERTSAIRQYFARLGQGTIDRFWSLHRTRLIADRDTRIKGLTLQFAHREARIETVTQWVGERDEHIGQLTLQVADRERQIEGLTLHLADREARIETMTQWVRERDEHIGQLTLQVADWERQIEGLTLHLADREAHIETMTQWVRDRDEHIGQLTLQVADPERQIQTLVVGRDTDRDARAIQAADFKRAMVDHERRLVVAKEQIGGYARHIERLEDERRGLLPN